MGARAWGHPKGHSCKSVGMDSERKAVSQRRTELRLGSGGAEKQSHPQRVWESEGWVADTGRGRTEPFEEDEEELRPTTGA